MEAMQQAYIDALYDLAEQDARVISLLSDSGTDYDRYFIRDFPKQCINFGIAEENQVAAAAGMASMGKIPFVYTSGAFLVYRSLEFLRDDICLRKANVKLVGMGSGLAWSTLGATHHTTEDIAILCALPGLTVLSPASPAQVRWAVQEAYRIQGPVYLRIGMKGEPEIFPEGKTFSYGKNETLTEGTDATVFGTGSILSEVLKAGQRLEAQGLRVQIVDVSTLKPLDAVDVLQEAKRTKRVVTVEEHNCSGGLGALVAQTLADAGLEGVRMLRIGLPDRFACGYGTLQEVRAANGLDAAGIVKRVLPFLQHNAEETL